MSNINNLLKGQARTSVFIAHRLKTVVEAGTSDSASMLLGDLLSFALFQT